MAGRYGQNARPSCAISCHLDKCKPSPTMTMRCQRKADRLCDMEAVAGDKVWARHASVLCPQLTYRPETDSDVSISLGIGIAPVETDLHVEHCSPSEVPPMRCMLWRGRPESISCPSFGYAGILQHQRHHQRRSRCASPSHLSRTQLTHTHYSVRS